MIEYRTKASVLDEWGDWGPLSIPNQLVFSGWYNPRYMEFREAKVYPYHHSQYPDEVLDRHVRQAVYSLEKRVHKLEQISHTHVAPMMPSS